MLIDLDGTLADSLSVMRLAYFRFLEKFKAKPTDEEFLSLNGPPFAEVVRRLKVTHMLEDGIDSLLGVYFDIVDQVYADVAPSAGARDLLNRAQTNQCLVGIVTSNSSKRTQRWLEKVGFSHLIDFIVSGDDVKYGKPSPEPYLLAANRVACPSTCIIAIEDSVQGAQSAMEAGLTTFLLTDLNESGTWPSGVVPIRSLYQLIELFD